MSSHRFSRRTLLRGLGVTMALPWMESLTVWGDEPRGGIKPASEAPVRLAVLFSGNGFHSKEWWAKGEGKAMELGQGARAAGRLSREDALHPRPLQRRRRSRETFTARRPAICFPARRSPPAARFVPAPASTSCSRSATAARPRCRASCSAARSRTRRSTRTIRCSTARTFRGARRRRRRRWRFIPRSRSTGCSRTRCSAATRACSTPCSPTRSDLRRQHQHDRSAQARRVSRLRARRGAADRERRQEGRTARLAADARQAEHPAPARRHSAGHRRAHAADVRHPRARLPDRHDAHHHAQAEQRSLARCASRTSASTT